MFVCLYLIRIHISEPIWTKFCTHLPLRLEETVGYIWSENIWPFLIFYLLRRERVPNPRHEIAAGAGVFRQSVITVILAGVSVTSRKWHCSRRQFRVLTGSVVHYGWCIQNAENWTECTCVKMETWWDRKQVNKGLQLQLLQ